jgi:release factor glutamine methyltransferase
VTPRALIRAAAARLQAAGIEADEARADARALYLLAAGLDGAGLILSEDAPAPVACVARFDAMLARRAAREPISHIAGEVAFWGRSFLCDRRALAPRPDSATLIAAALAWGRAQASPPSGIADLGTGTGCLILTLLAEWPHARGVGIDLSPDALTLAAENAARLELGPRVRLARGDWLAGEDGPFDLIVSNPPYIETGVLASLDPEVRSIDPVLALDGGRDGLVAYRALIPQALAVLRPGGALIVETGFDQGQSVSDLMVKAGFLAVRTGQDLGGRDRIVSGTRPG